MLWGEHTGCFHQALIYHPQHLELRKGPGRADLSSPTWLSRPCPLNIPMFHNEQHRNIVKSLIYSKQHYNLGELRW